MFVFLGGLKRRLPLYELRLQQMCDLFLVNVTIAKGTLSLQSTHSYCFNCEQRRTASTLEEVLQKRKLGDAISHYALKNVVFF